MWRNSLLLAVGLVLSCHVNAQDQHSPFKYESAGSLVLNASLNLDWYENTFYYRWDTPNGTTFYRGDVAKKQPELLFSEEDVKLVLEKIGANDLKSWKLYRVEPTDKKNAIKFNYKGDYYSYNWKQKALHKIALPKQTLSTAEKKTGKISAPYWQKPNADGSMYIFAKGNQQASEIYMFWL